MCLSTEKNTGWSRGYSEGTGTAGAVSGASQPSEGAVPGAGRPQAGSEGAQARDAAGIPGTRSRYQPRAGLAQAEHAPGTEQGLIKSF